MGYLPPSPVGYWLRAVFPSALALVTQGRAASQVPEKCPGKASKWTEVRPGHQAQPKPITCMGSKVGTCFCRVMMFPFCFL